MYRYMPPKSSVWGHSLRKMKPDNQKILIDEFLQTAVAEHQFSSGSIIYQRSFETLFDDNIANESKSYFIKLLSTISGEADLSSLNAEQFDLCLRALQNDNSLFISGKSGITLTSTIKISKWLIDNTEVPTESSLSVSYGAKPWLTTFFTFSDIDEFNYIKHVFNELGICRLNEKHLKTVRRKNSNKSP